MKQMKNGKGTQIPEKGSVFREELDLWHQTEHLQGLFSAFHSIRYDAPWACTWAALAEYRLAPQYGPSTSSISSSWGPIGHAAS